MKKFLIKLRRIYFTIGIYVWPIAFMFLLLQILVMIVLFSIALYVL